MNYSLPLSAKVYSAEELDINTNRLDRRAVEIAVRLQKAGHDGLLVGGCVRDLMLGRTPKDFDIATDAPPERVKSLFPRSRIIGHRFRLVHVSIGYGRERTVIEVATYRSGSAGSAITNAKGRIVRDNTYGTLHEDVLRRDFTANALYFDPLANQIIDHLDGVGDIRSRQLRLIGDAQTRFAEDPVRMLRALRFKAKLGLQIAPSLLAQIDRDADLLADVSPARLFDEALKFFHHGFATASWHELCQSPLGEILFPQTLAAVSAQHGHRHEAFITRALKNTDHRVRQNLPVIPAFMFSVLLWAPFRMAEHRLRAQGCESSDARWMAMDQVFREQARSVSIPWRVREPACQIWEMQSLLLHRPVEKIRELLGHRRFRAAYDFLLLRADSDDIDPAIVQWWTTIQELERDAQRSMIENLAEECAVPDPQGKGRVNRRDRGWSVRKRRYPGRHVREY